jgi:cytoskeletal protein RodZ
MSEFTEKLTASIIKENNQGYLILKNCWSLFDPNIGVGGNDRSFNISIRPENAQEIVAEESVRPEDISFSSPDKGYKIRLSVETFNSVSSVVNRYNGKFETFVREFTTADNKVCGSTQDFFTSPEGDISLILDSQEPQAQYVNSPSAAFVNSSGEASSENLFSGVNQEAPIHQNIQPDTGAKKNKLMLPLIAAIAALILLLAAFLVWKNFFSADDTVTPQSPAVTETQNTEESKNEPSVADESKKAEEENKNTQSAASDENTQKTSEPAASEEPNAPADAQAAVQPSAQTPVSSANGASAACTLSSEKDEVIISNCLSSNPKIEVISSLSEQSLENDRCDLGKRLLSSYGRKDSSAAYMFAKFFDPNSNAQSKCIQKDKTQALYWYQKAADLGMSEANEAIGKLKE